MSEFFGVKCGWALDCFDSQAQLRDDRLYTAETQRDLDLSFTTKSRTWAGTRLEDELAPDGMQRKLTIGGHYGQGSASTRANGLDSTKELPCPQTNSLIEELVEKNAIQWTALFDVLREAVAKEFQDDPTDTKTYANVKDFLFSGTSCWRDFLFTSNEVHIQSVGRRAPAPRRRASNGDPALDGGGDQAVGGEARVALPEHYDGGRGFIILAISLWTTRIVRMWLSDGTVVEMRTEPGHCYLANFVGVQHQVLHAADGAEAGRGHTHTSVLDDFELIYFSRSSFFRHFCCSRPTRLWAGVEARLVACTCEAFATWAATAKLVLPSLADLAKRVELRKTRCPKKRRRETDAS